MKNQFNLAPRFSRACTVVICLMFGFLTAGCTDDQIAAALAVLEPELGVEITNPAPPPVTQFAQTVASQDISNEVAPGQANDWDISSNFGLIDGGNDQFDGAVDLIVGATLFPPDQTYAELAFFTPLLDASDGVKTASVSDGTKILPNPLAGLWSAYLHPTSDSRLRQTLDLTAATGAISLSWSDDAGLNGGSILGYTPQYQVVVRDTAGALLAPLFSTAVSTVNTARTAILTAHAGQVIVLSFENASASSGGETLVDSVSVTDGALVEYVTNGDFETGDLTGWTSNTPQEVQNMTSGVRLLEGLDVRRSFYTEPGKAWGRWVDVFENNTAADITKTIVYTTDLGSDNSGIIYDTPNTGMRALTSWDGCNSDRDIGWVFGDATVVGFVSDPLLCNSTGSEFMNVTFDITVPAGGHTAILNFVVMNGIDTADTAVDVTALATEIDTVAANIVNNFLTDPQYARGMTQAQINAVSNF